MKRSRQHSIASQTIAMMASTALAMQPMLSFANPVGGVVSAGSATITQSGNMLNVNQSSTRAVIDWRGFDIAPGETTQFSQPSSSAIALNRVNSTSASHIDGTLVANGNIVIINQNGVVFGAGSHVDVNGLVATTADIDNAAFMNSTGKLTFDKPGNPDASIVNNGVITAAQAGLVGLVAPNVVNNGVITAKLGRIQLASGDTATVDMYGDDLMEVAVSDQVKSQMVSNTGTLSAAGGTIAMTAAAGNAIVNSLINVQGELKAPAVAQRNGEIIIYAQGSNAVAGNIAANKGQKSGSSTVLVSGTLDASGVNAGETGGSISVLGDNVGLLAGATLNASGYNGGGTIKVGGDFHGAGSTATALNTYIDSAAQIFADALENGNGGNVAVWSDSNTQFYGSISAQGGAQSGNGGYVETSGHTLTVLGTVNASAPNGAGGSWLLDPSDLTITANTTSGTTTSSGTNPITWQTTAGSNEDSMSAATIDSELRAGTNVIIQTTNTGSGGNGDIFVNNAIDPVTGSGSLTLSAYRNITVSSSITLYGGSLTLQADNAANHSGFIDVAAAINTNGGNITMGGGSGAISAGSGYAWGNAGQAAGININGVTVSSGGGNIIMNGQGYTGGTNTMDAFGIELQSGAQIAASNSGTVTLTGVGGGSGSGGSNYGVFVFGDGNTIETTGSGGIIVNGTGGTGSSGSNLGIYVTGGTVETTGGGVITLTGIAGSGTFGLNNGVHLESAASIMGSGGAISITGTGGNSSSDQNEGIYLFGSTISNTGAGTLTLTGTASGSGGSRSDIGVSIGGISSVSTVDGALNITGTGGDIGGTGTNNYGVSLGAIGSSAVKTTGAGNITVNGIRGGGNTSNNYGVVVSSANGLQTAGSGSIAVAADTLNLGQANSINSAGNVTLAPYTAGTTIGVEGGAGTLQVSSAIVGDITAGSGKSLIIGATGDSGLLTAGAGTWAENLQLVSGSGGITVSGAQTMGAHNLTLQTDGTLTVSAGITSTGTVTIDPASVGTTVGIAGGAGTLQVTSTTLNNITAGEVDVGNIADTGLLTAGAYTWGNNAKLMSGSGGITVSGAQTMGAHNLTLQTDGTLTVGANLSGTGTLTLAPAGTATSIGVNGGAGTLQITSSDLGFIQPGFAGITVGGGTGYSGTINVNNYNWNAPVTYANGSGNVFISNNSGNLTISSAINATGSNPVTLTASGDIFVNAAITTQGTPVIIDANNADANSGYVQVNANITTNGGNLTIGGGSAAITAGSGYAWDNGDGSSLLAGVQINDGATVSTGAGNIVINGHGNNSAVNSSDGVDIGETYTSTAKLQTTSGSITINGTGGGGSGAYSYGDQITGTVTTATGAITINGTGGSNSGGSNFGLADYGTISSTGSSSPGAITLSGTGGSAGTSNNGIMLSTATLTGNGASISLTGSGSIGIDVDASTVTGGSGSITMNGTSAGGSGDGYYGVQITDNATVSITGSGNSISITGTGGNGTGTTGENTGVVIGSYSGQKAQLSSADGNITITGTGGATPNGQYSAGVALLAKTGLVQSTGSGNITISGTGGTGQSSDGVDLNMPLSVHDGNLTVTGATIASGNYSNADGIQVGGVGYGWAGSVTATGIGNITLNGTAYGGTGNTDNGIYIVGSPGITAASGSITLNGVGQGATNSNQGIVSGSSLGNNTIGGALDTGAITFNTDSFAWSGLSVRTAGIVTIAPYTASTSIGFSGGAGTLQVTQAMMDAINAPTVTIGRSDGTGLITTGAFTWESTLSTLNLESGGAAGAITIGGAITQANVANANLNLYAGDDIIDGGAITASGADKLNVYLDSNYANTNSGYVQVNANLTTNGGNLTIGGGSAAITAGSGYAYDNGDGGSRSDAIVINDGVTVSTGAGNIVLNGHGNNAAVNFSDAIDMGYSATTAKLQTTSGNISLNGIAGGGTTSDGLFLSGTITTVSGAISLTGDGGSSASTRGVGVHPWAGTISSTGTGAGLGAITITGIGGSNSGGNNYGVKIESGLITTKDANVVINGTGGGTGSNDYGTYIGHNITSTGSGAITINSIGANGAIALFDTGANTIGGASDTGNITLNQDTATWGSLALRTTSTVTIAPYTASTSVGFSGGAGTLQVTQGLMDLINAPSVTIGRLDGTGLLTTGAFTWESTLGTLNLESGGAAGNITIGGAITQANVANANLNFYAGDDIIDGGAITASGGDKLNVYMDSNYANTNSGYVQVNANLTTNGGNLTIGGGSAAITAGSGYAYDNGDGSSLQDGVLINDGVTVSTGAGNIIMNGTGYSAEPGAWSDGVDIGYNTGTGTVLQTTSGNITINGIGGGGTGAGGVTMVGVNNLGTVTTTSGAVTLTGNSNIGSANIGVYNDGTISSTGTGAGLGAITLTGTASNSGGTRSDGVELYPFYHASLISTKDANIVINGSGSGTGGFSMFLDENITSAGAGNITLNSISGPLHDNGSQTIGGALDTGNIALNQDKITWGSLTAQTTGTVTIAPYTASKSIGFSGGAGTLQVTQAMMNAINAPTVTIGRSDGTGLITTGAFTWESTLNTLNLESGGAAGNITIGGAITQANVANANLNLYAGDDIIDGGAITASGADKLNVYLDSNYANTNSGYVQVNANLTTNGGNLTIGGGSAAITAGSGYAYDNGDGSSNNDAVQISDGVTVNTGAGNVIINGHGNDAASTFSDGVDIGIAFNGSTAKLQTTSGNISINGIAGKGNASDGVYVSGTATTATGAINITGTTTSSESSALHEDGGTIASTGAGTITLNAIGTGAHGGIEIYESANTIGGASDTGNITINADSLNLIVRPTIQTTGTVTIAPYTASTSIGFSGGAGTLQITQAMMDAINAPTVTIGRLDGTGLITTSGFTWESTLHTLNLESGGAAGAINITAGGFTQASVANANLNLYAGSNITDNAAIAASGADALNIYMDANYANANSGFIQINNSITTNGGNLTLGGGSAAITAGSGYAWDNAGDGTRSDGVFINNAITVSTGAGNIIINGEGYNAATGLSNGVMVGGALLSSGNISINGIGGANSGNTNTGITITGSGAITESGAGTITLTGTGGGTGASANNYGIQTSGTIQSTATGGGGITLIGYGGDNGGSGGSNYGTDIAGGIITSKDGNILIDGNTGTTTGQTVSTATGNSNMGVEVASGGVTISSTGNGTITINGVGGGSGASTTDAGVITSTSSMITSVTGNIAITGTGAATTGGSDYGIYEFGGTIQTTGAATITLTGTGGGTGAATSNYGIYIQSAVQSIGTNGGGITLIGYGGDSGGSGVSNDGIALSSSTITSKDGNILIDGNTGTTTGQTVSTSTGNNNHGVVQNGTISSTGIANITINGVGAGSGNSNGLWINGNISASGSGNIVMTSAASGTAVDLFNNGTATIIGGASDTGNITFNQNTWTWGSLTAQTTGSGVVTIAPYTASTTVGVAGGAGTLQVTQAIMDAINAPMVTIGRADGTGGLTANAYNWSSSAEFITGSGQMTISGAQNMGAHNLTLMTDSDLALNAAVSGTGNLTIAPTTGTTSMGINLNTQTLNLSGAEMANITTGWNSETFGAAGDTGDVRIAPTTFNDNTFIYGGYIATSGSISMVKDLTISSIGTLAISDPFTKSSGADATLTLKATDDVNIIKNITSTSNKLNIVVDADSDGSGSGAIAVGDGTNAVSINSNGGNITFGGGNGTISADSGFAMGDAANGSGIYFNGGPTAAVTLSAGNGNVIMNGQAYQDPGDTYTHSGVNLQFGTINTTGGNITLYGNTAAGGDATTESGVLLKNGTISTQNGTVSLYGNYGLSSNPGYAGVDISTSTVNATGSGGINLWGQNAHYGVLIDNGASNYENSVDGNINITGIGNGALSTGIAIEFAHFAASGLGNITFTADQLSDLSGAGTNTISGLHTVTFDPYTASTSIGFSGGAGTLQITQAIMDAINAPTVVVGSAGSGDITTAAYTWDSPITSLTLYGNNITVGGNVTKSAGADSTLMLEGNGNITTTGSPNISSSSNKLNVVFDADADANHAGYIGIGYGTTIASNGGNITMGGGTLSGGLPTGSAWGVAGQQSGIGIWVYDSTLNAGGGNITLTGTGATGGTNDQGVNIDGGIGVVETAANGNIAINSTGSDSVGFTSVGTISAVNGNITITGTGGNGAGSNYGVSTIGTVETTGTGNISITGTGGSTGNGNIGIITQYGGGDLVTSTGGGNITITGIGGTGSNSYGIYFYTGIGGTNTFGGASNTGNITFNADSIFNSTSPVIRTAGTVTFAPYTASTSIGFSGGAGTLQITQAIMDAINAPTVTVGRLDGTGLITTGAFNWEHTLNVLNLESGGAGGEIIIGGNITKGIDNGSVANTNDGSLNVIAGADITTSGAVTISSSSTYGKLNVLMDSDYAGNGGAIVIGDGTNTSIATNNGSLTLGGGSGTISAGTLNADGTVGSAASGYAVGDATYADGIEINSKAMITTGSGNIILNGQGYNGGTGSNYGVFIVNNTGYSTTGIETTGAGNIYISGIGGTGTGGSNDGVYIKSNSYNATVQVSSVDGAIDITGTGGGSAGGNIGIRIAPATNTAYTRVVASGNGSIVMNGTGGGTGAGTGNNGVETNGWWAASDTTISTNNGNLTIVGIGGSTSGGSNYGVASSSLLQSTGAGNISVTGTGGTGGGTGNYGITTGFTCCTEQIIATGGGNITLTGNGNGSTDIWTNNGSNTNFGGTGDTGNITFNTDTLNLARSTTQTTGTVTFAPRTASTTIGFSGGAGTLQITQAIMDAINAPTVTVGRSDGTGLLTTGAFTWESTLNNLNLYGGNIDIGNITKSAGSNDATLTAASATDIAFTGGYGTGISSTSHKLNVVLDADTGGAGGAIVIGGGADNEFIRSNGGNINIGGGALSGGLPSGAAVGDATNNSGIYLNAATLDAQGGNIILDGTGYNNANNGIYISNASTVQTSGSGTISMTGSQNAAFQAAIYLSDSTVSAVNGAITLNGGSGTTGVAVTSTSTVDTSGTGNITLNGAGTSRGIYLSGGTNSIFSSGGGTITLTASSGGIATNSGSAVLGGASQTGNITLNADSLSYNIIPSVQTTGTVTFAPYTASTTVGVTGGAGTLQVTSGILNSVTAGNVTIGASADSGLLDVGAADLSADAYNLALANGAGDIRFDLAGGTFKAPSGYNLTATTISDGQVNSFGSSGTVQTEGAGSITFDSDGHLILESALTINAAGSGSVTLKAHEGDIILTNGAGVTTHGGNITLDSGIRFGVGPILIGDGTTLSTIASNGGNIVIGGESNPLTMAATGNGTYPVGVNINKATISSGAGNITITGQGLTSGTNTSNAYGVELQNGSVVQASNGNINITATGGGSGSGNSNHGLLVIGTGSTIETTGSGAVNVTATGGSPASSGGDNAGMVIDSIGGIQTTGGGAITVSGTGGAIGNNNYGTYVGGSILGSGGTMLITGSGGNNEGEGVFINGGAISNTGTGSLTVTGTGGTNGGDGVFVDGIISTVNGALNVTGTGESSFNGISFNIAGSTIKTTGSGNLTINGVDGGSGYGLSVTVANGVQTTGTGNITVNADTISLGQANDISSVGNVTLAPYNAGTTVGVGTGTGTLALNAGTLGDVTVGTGQTLTIGATTDTGLMDVGAIDLSAKIYNLVLLNGSGNIQFDPNGGIFKAPSYGLFAETVSGNITSNSAGTVQTEGTGTLWLQSGGNIDFASATSFNATGSGSVDLFSNTDIILTGGAGITTQDRDIVLDSDDNDTNGSKSGAIVIGDGTTLSTIASNGGNITLEGGAGIGDAAIGDANNIVGINLNKATISSVGGVGFGSITMTGKGYTGGVNTSGAYGVELHNGALVQGSNSNITVIGTGGGTGGGGDNVGVAIANAGSLIKTTGSGAIIINGTGGIGGNGGNEGVDIGTNGTNAIQTTGGGAITITGHGGAAGNNQTYGFYADGAIAGSGGAISITGIGGNGNSNADDGIALFAATLSNTGSGALTLNGTAGGTGISGSDDGVAVWNNSFLSTVNGALTITGTGGDSGGTGINNYGVYVGATTSGTVKTTGSGNIIINGIRGGGDTSSNYGLYVGNANGLQTTGTGSVTVNADTISLNQAGDINSAGNVTLAPYNAGTTVGVGTGTGTLALNAALLGDVTLGTGKTLTIGANTDTGTLDVGAVDLSGGAYNVAMIDGTGNILFDLGGGTFKAPSGYNLTFTTTNSNIIGASIGTVQTEGAGNLTLNAGIDVETGNSINFNATGTGSVTMAAAKDIYIGGGANITTQGGTITFDSDSTDTNGSKIGSIALGDGSNLSTITSNGGAIILGGGTAPATMAAMGDATSTNTGITLNKVTLSSGAGNITMTGKGTAAAIVGYGVDLTNSTLQTSSGNISITGTDGTTGNTWWSGGVAAFGDTIKSTGAGNITITGTATSSVGAYTDAVDLQNNTAVTSSGGNITITGTASARAYSSGVNVEHSYGGVGIDSNFGSATVGTTGNGMVTITGSATDTQGNSQGIMVGLNGNVYTANGQLSLTGTGSNGGGNGTGVQVVSGGNSAVNTTGSGNIVISANSLGVSDWNYGTQKGIVTTGTGNITVNTDSLALTSLTGPAVNDIVSSGNVTINPLTASDTIGVAGGAGTLQITTADLGEITAGAGKTLTIGSSTGTGAIDVAAETLNNNLLLQNQSGGITFEGAQTLGTNTLTALTGGNITLAQGAKIVSTATSGNSIVLSAGINFINNDTNDGANALVAGTGTARWLVYAASQGAAVLNGLASTSTHYGDTYSTYGPASVTESGNVFLFLASGGEIILTADNQNMTYGGSIPTLTYTYFCSTGCTQAASLTGAPSLTIAGATSSSGNYTAGSHTINISDTLTGGYSSYALILDPGTLTIARAAITVTGISGTSKVYDGTAADTISGTAGLSGKLAGDTVNLATGSASASFADKNAASGKTVTFSGYTISGADASNYTLSQPATSTANITPASLTVTANNKSKTAGASDPALTFSYSGLVGGDSSASFTGSLSRDPGENVGTYNILRHTLLATGNYTIGSFNDGVFTINAGSGGGGGGFVFTGLMIPNTVLAVSQDPALNTLMVPLSVRIWMGESSIVWQPSEVVPAPSEKLIKAQNFFNMDELTALSPYVMNDPFDLKKEENERGYQSFFRRKKTLHSQLQANPSSLKRFASYDSDTSATW